MNKKSIFIVLSVLLILFIFYKIADDYISKAKNNSNMRGIEAYVSAIRYSYTRAYLKGNTDVKLEDLIIEVNIDIKCESKSIDNSGNIELRGCSVDNSKTKYKYVNGKVEKEKK